MEVDSDISNEYINTDSEELLVVSNDELNESEEEIPLFNVVDESSGTLLSINSPICCLDVDPIRKRRVLFGSCDDNAYISDLPEKPISNDGGSNIYIGTRKILQGHIDTVSCVSYSVDGSYFATGGCDGIIKVYSNQDLNEGELITTLEGPSDELEFICWHPRGPCIFGGGVDGTGWLWMLPEGKVISVLSGHSGSITCGDFTSEGKLVCTGSLDGSVVIWNPKNGESIHKITRNNLIDSNNEYSMFMEDLGVVSLRSHRKNPLLGVGLTNGTFSLIQSETGRVLSLNKRHKDSLESLEFTTNTDPLIATGDISGELIIWNYEYNRENFSMRHDELEHSNGILPGITSISWSGNKNNTLIATGCLDGTIRIWDYRTGENFKTLKGHKSGVMAIKIVEFDDNYEYILRIVSTGDDGRCLLWDVRK